MPGYHLKEVDKNDQKKDDEKIPENIQVNDNNMVRYQQNMICYGQYQPYMNNYGQYQNHGNNNYGPRQFRQYEQFGQYQNNGMNNYGQYQNHGMNNYVQFNQQQYQQQQNRVAQMNAIQPNIQHVNIQKELFFSFLGIKVSDGTTMELSVKGLNGKSVKLKIGPNDTIHNVKAKIQDVNVRNGSINDDDEPLVFRGEARAFRWDNSLREFKYRGDGIISIILDGDTVRLELIDRVKGRMTMLQWITSNHDVKIVSTDKFGNIKSNHHQTGCEVHWNATDYSNPEQELFCRWKVIYQNVLKAREFASIFNDLQQYLNVNS